MGEEVAATIQVRDIGTWREEGSRADSGSVQAVEGEVREREGSRKAMLLQLCSKDQHSTWRLVGQAESGPPRLLDQNLCFSKTRGDFCVPSSLKSPVLHAN